MSKATSFQTLNPLKRSQNKESFIFISTLVTWELKSQKVNLEIRVLQNLYPPTCRGQERTFAPCCGGSAPERKAALSYRALLHILPWRSPCFACSSMILVFPSLWCSLRLYSCWKLRPWRLYRSSESNLNNFTNNKHLGPVMQTMSTR